MVDIEGNGLEGVTKIWCVVLRDLDTNNLHTFNNICEDAQERERFLNVAKTVELWVGHNILGYDLPVLQSLCSGYVLPGIDCCIDTLIISKLLDYSRVAGHSLEAYGEEFNVPKSKFTDYSKWSQELLDRCCIDTEITLKVYLKYLRYIQSKEWLRSIRLEHKFQLVVNSLHSNGFSFNTLGATKLLLKVSKELEQIDQVLLKEFPPKLKLIREITPKETKYGTLSRTDFRFEKSGDLSEYNGGPFCRCEWSDFNPSSHRQIVTVLSNSGWSPVDKTQTHIETERELNRMKYGRKAKSALDTALETELVSKLQELKKTGWKVNENNLGTLPSTAPSPARTLARRILLESRRRTLTEWLGLVDSDHRIHGEFFGIGAWTHRMAHQKPNTANIPNPTDLAGKVKLYGAEMRSLWQAPKNRLLVGVDAEGIQLRIFAHLIDNKEFTDAIVNGKKSDKTDPHSFNARVLGSVCKSRAAAKRFIFALLLGAGIGKLAEILAASEDETRAALDNLMVRYQGFATLKERIIPNDAKRGWFVGIDGRKVLLPADSLGGKRHLAMSGYLQSGEAIVMKSATVKWIDKLAQDDAMIVNFVHDEWQTECPNNMEIAIRIAKMQADSLEEVGRELELKCPLAGSYYNDDIKDFTIGTNWKVTH